MKKSWEFLIGSINIIGGIPGSKKATPHQLEFETLYLLRQKLLRQNVTFLLRNSNITNAQWRPQFVHFFFFLIQTNY